MSAESEISWTRHTFNVWWGCARVSPGCVNCYADTLATRWGHELWRRHGPRREMSEQYWRQPLKWNRDAPGRVFCGSMCDVFEDHPEPEMHAMQDAARARLWGLIRETPNLTWLLLTKRPQNVAGMVPWGEYWPRNVWIGTSVEDQRRADERIPVLLDLPAVVRFISAEPLVGPVNLTSVGAGFNCLDPEDTGHDDGLHWWPGPTVNWVISGGESGRNARPVHPDWLRTLRDQCQAYAVPYHLKQLGAWAPVLPDEWQNRKASDWLVRHDGKAWPLAEPHGAEDGTEVTVRRVGKKAAGRLLDGRVWDEFPTVVAA